MSFVFILSMKKQKNIDQQSPSEHSETVLYCMSPCMAQNTQGPFYEGLIEMVEGYTINSVHAVCKDLITLIQ